MLCEVTEKCFYGGGLLEIGDKVNYEGEAKALPPHFKPLAKPEPEKPSADKRRDK